MSCQIYWLQKFKFDFKKEVTPLFTSDQKYTHKIQKAKQGIKHELKNFQIEKLTHLGNFFYKKNI